MPVRANANAPSQPTGAFARPQAHALGIGLMCAGMLSVTTQDTIGKYLGTLDLPVLSIVWGRYMFATLAMVVLLPFVNWRRMVVSKFPLIELLRGLFTTGATLMLITAVQFIGLAEAVGIALIAPLLITALAVPILGERVGWRRWAAVIIGSSGALLIARPGLGVMHPASLLVVGTAFCFAMYQCLTRKIAHREDPYAQLFYVNAIGALIMSVVVLFDWQTPSTEQLGWMVGMGSVALFSHFMIIYALTFAPSSVLAPFHYTQMLFATAIGFLVFGDLPDIWTFIGAGIVIGAGLFTVYRETRVRQQRAGLVRSGAAAAPAAPRQPAR